MANGVLYFGFLLWTLSMNVNHVFSKKMRLLLGKGSAQEPGIQHDVTLLGRNINWRHLQIAERDREQQPQMDAHVSVQLREHHTVLEENEPLLSTLNEHESNHCHCCCCKCCRGHQKCDDSDDECIFRAIDCFCDALIALLVSALIMIFVIGFIVVIWGH